MTKKEKLANAILKDAGVHLNKHSGHYTLKKNPQAHIPKHHKKPTPPTYIRTK